MAQVRIIPVDKNSFEVSKNGEVLQKFSISSTTASGLISISDGTLLRCSNDNEIIEFNIIHKGTLDLRVNPGNIPQRVGDDIDIDGDFAWIAFMVYPQKLILKQD